jgi:hypothetical protein
MSQCKSLLTGAEFTICLVLAIIMGMSGAVRNPGAGMGWYVGYVVGAFLGLLLVYLAIKGLWRLMLYIVRRLSSSSS